MSTQSVSSAPIKVANSRVDISEALKMTVMAEGKSQTPSSTNAKKVTVHAASDTKDGVALPTAIFKVHPLSKKEPSNRIYCFLDSGPERFSDNSIVSCV